MRPSGEGSLRNPQTVHQLPEVLNKCRRIVRSRLARVTVSAPRIRYRANVAAQRRDQVIEDVRVVPHAMQQNQRFATSAPVEVVQLDPVDEQYTARVR